MVGSTALKKGFFIPAFLNTEPPQPFRTLTIAEQSMKVKKMLMRIFRDSRKVAGSQPGIDEYDFVEDLSSWEFVIPSDDDDDHEAYYSPNDKDLEVFVDGDDVEIGIEPEAVVGETVLKQDYFCLHGSPYPDVSTGSPSPAQIAVALDVAPVGLNDYKNDHGYVPDYDINQEEEDYDEDDFDLDEESFPYCVRNKVAKERMKELSKMTCQRMSKPKSSPYYCNRPGNSSFYYYKNKPSPGTTVKIIRSR